MDTPAAAALEQTDILEISSFLSDSENCCKLHASREAEEMAEKVCAFLSLPHPNVFL